jgi:hypothetical protein
MTNQKTLGSMARSMLSQSISKFVVNAIGSAAFSSLLLRKLLAPDQAQEIAIHDTTGKKVFPSLDPSVFKT